MAGAPEAADPSRDVGTLSVDASPSVPPPAAAPLTVDERFALVRSVGEECIQEGELMNLLVKKTVPDCYDGFEPSGRVHIVQGVMKVINVNKLTSAGSKEYTSADNKVQSEYGLK
ncbi:hypothetical protein OPV22_028177 [Ensete ventricosum]|uniref:tyrosine--tRNA ligase n=1 Tax=Ensete ventricosum TaxID=4639 RepID=A0AAV8Q1Y2_ENSVE|nr:hypothetical protein OPV22_028177 [Ensete ventricosum]